MGLFRLIFGIILPGVGLSMFLSLRLGSKLPLVCRDTGRNFGMLYNYFKVIIFNLKPKEKQSNEIISMLRNINQQSHAFTRELQMNLLSKKNDLKQIIPGIEINPFENVGLKNEPPLKLEKEENGVNILEHAILERRRIINKKKEMMKLIKHFIISIKQSLY